MLCKTSIRLMRMFVTIEPYGTYFYHISHTCTHALKRYATKSLRESIRPFVRGHLVKMLITLDTLYILHHSAGNDQFAFHLLVLTPDTD